MITKNIYFDYNGGTEAVVLNVNPSALPISVDYNNAEWINVDINLDNIKVNVGTTYDYADRQEDVHIFNANGNELILNVYQSGYEGISINCDEQVVLSDSYYSMSNQYGVYVTVYGGKNQEVTCKELKPYIRKVWDNSDEYNDFVINIPKGLSGEFVLQHAEYSRYRSYCKEHGIPFQDSKVKRKLNIVQITEKDKIGTMVIAINGIQYSSSPNEPIIIIKYGEDMIIDVVSTKYIHQISNTKYEVIDGMDVDITYMPSWIKVERDGNKIILSARDKVTLTNRKCKLRLTNKTNSHQFIDLIIEQKGEE